MIYRSRYLDRLLFSPLGQRRRQTAPGILRPERGSSGGATSPRSALARQDSLGDRVPYLSSRELRDIVGRCEQAITSGRAQIEDYEAFVICQQELSGRS